MDSNEFSKNSRTTEPVTAEPDQSPARPEDRACAAPNDADPGPSAPACNFPVKTGRTGRAKTQFEPGVSGNPRGRPRGVLNRSTLLARSLLQDEAVSLTRKLIDVALAGNPAALKLCIQRLISIPDDDPVLIDHLNLALSGPRPDPAADPDDDSPRDPRPQQLLDAHDHLLRAIAGGEITPAEAERLTRVLESRRRTFETIELANRLAAIETRLNGK